MFLRVSNSGKRIDPTTVRLLAEPFYRTAGRARSEVQGEGLGLAIVRSHDGTIELSANGASGLTVTISLPSHTQTNHH